MEGECVLWGMRVLVPKRWQKRVLEMVHEGIVRMKTIARVRVVARDRWRLERVSKIVSCMSGSSKSPSCGTTTSMDLACQTMV